MSKQIESCNVLVIGACGYLGSRVVRWLVDESKLSPSQITVMDAAKPLPEREIQHIKYHQANIADRDVVCEIISNTKPDVVIHTASPPYYTGNLDAFLRSNVEGTRNLLDAAVKQPSVKAFVYTSSSSVVHDFVSNLVEADETYPLLFMPEQPQPYHHSKALAEKLALEYNRKRCDFVVSAIRPSAMFGPGEHVIIPSMVRRAKDGSARFQIGNGKNQADFTYVDNTAFAHVLAAEALLKAAENDPHAVQADMRVEGEAFTITNDVHPNFWDFSRKIGAMAGYPIEPDRIVTIPAFIGLGIASIIEWIVWVTSFGTKTPQVTRMDLHYSTITRTFDISKAKKRLGYRPRYSLEEGMKLAIAPLLNEDKKDI